ncbi:hypothetical protein [Paenibacillus kandeliae]|uniref:hypothetical protein n=1 Tax=Paenibacillus kandeliae TaxID=3231269 RepID=UPI00345A686B
MNNDDLKKSIEAMKINLSDIKIPNFTQPSYDLTAKTQEITAKLAQDKVEERFYREESLRALKAIETNTDLLAGIVILFQENNEKLFEIQQLVFEILAIASLKSEPEINTAMTKCLTKITALGEGVAAAQTLITTLTTIVTLTMSKI